MGEGAIGGGRESAAGEEKRRKKEKLFVETLVCFCFTGTLRRHYGWGWYSLGVSVGLGLPVLRVSSLSRMIRFESNDTLFKYYSLFSIPMPGLSGLSGLVSINLLCAWLT